jgi:hypothetical protein
MEIPSSVTDERRDAPDEIRDAPKYGTSVADFGVFLSPFRTKTTHKVIPLMNKAIIETEQP